MSGDWSHTVAPSGAALRNLIVENRDGIMVVDGRGLVLFANAAAERLLRPVGAALAGTEFGHPTVAEDMAEIDISATGAVAEMRVAPLEWEGRRAHLVTLRNVTARHRAARERDRDVALLTEAERVAGLGSWELEISTGHLRRSAGYLRILGRGPEDLAEDPHLSAEVVHPDDRSRWLRAFDTARRGEAPLEIEYRIVRPDGEVRTVHTVAETILGADGRPERLRGIVRDLTGERRSERARRDAVRMLVEISDQVPAVISVRDLKGRLLFANTRYGRPPGMDREGAGPERAADRPPDGAVDEALRAEERDAVAANAAITRTHTVPLPDGTEAVRLSVHFPIHDDEGRVRAVGTVSVDATGQRRAAEEPGRVNADRDRQRLVPPLDQVERLDALCRLAGGIAHDFNNVLAVILGTAEFLSSELSRDDPRHADAEHIVQTARRGAELTGQLLVFSRREPARPEIIDLNDIVAGTEDMLRRTIGEDVPFTVRLSPDLAAVRMDRSHAEQMVLSLVIGARAAMPAGGRIVVETADVTVPGRPRPAGPRRPARPGSRHRPRPVAAEDLRAGRYTRLCVSDTGHGMSEEAARRAFGPFVTAGQGDRRDAEGAGPGLARVHGIVHDAGGQVTLDTRAGVGTTVCVYLPAAERGDAAGPSGERAPRGRGERVLVVEDEDPVREVVTGMLDRNGYEVIAARDAAEAMEICADPDTRIDVMLTDLVMPGMPGGRLAERLHSTSRLALPVLYMSGYSAEHMVVEDVDADVLHKPFDADTVLRRIRAAIDAARPDGPDQEGRL